MSSRIDKNGNRTKPHVCGRKCPLHINVIMTPEEKLLEEIFTGGNDDKPGNN